MNLKCYRYDDHDDNCQVIIAIMAVLDCYQRRKFFFYLTG